MTREDIIAMRKGTGGMERDGVVWTEQDRNLLDDLFRHGYGITEIAGELERSEPAIVQMLSKEGYFQREVKQRRRSTSSVRCICYKCEDLECCPYSPKNRAEINNTLCPKEEDNRV